MESHRTFHECLYWNARTYGRALRFPKRTIRAFLVGLCLLTPGTNWIIPFVNRIVREDIVVRYE